MKKLIVCLLVMMTLSAGAEVNEQAVTDAARFQNKLAVWFFSLEGEDHTGESILIRTPGGSTVLIDGGIPEAGAQINEYLSALSVDALDAVIATHMHIDHVGGLPAVLKKHAVGAVYQSPFSDYGTKAAADYKAALAAQGIVPLPLLAGDSFTLDGVRFDVLSPLATPREIEQKKISEQFLNDSSLVIMVSYEGKKLLFCGDATRAVEAEVIKAYGEALRADLIKIPHHGSSDASTKAFVEAVGAKNSVMCIYAFNDFNVYERYKKVGNKPYVTSLDGTVLYLTDGQTEEFFTCKERKGML